MRFHALTICVLAALIVGCAAPGISSTSSSKNAPQAKLSPVVVEPKWVPLTDGAGISYDVNYEYHPSEMKLSNGKVLRGKSWNGYLKSYVESFPPEKREPILQGITRHLTDYDKVEGFIRFEPVRYMSGPYSRASYLAVVGTLRSEGARAFLKFHYYGDSWLFANSFKVVTDGVPFQSPKMEFRQDHYGGNVWETAYLNLNKEEYRDLAEEIVSSEEAIIRFQGKQHYSDLTVTDRMREDIEYMLKALDQIGFE